MVPLPRAVATMITFGVGGWIVVGLGLLIGIVGVRVAQRAWSGRHTYLAMEEPPRAWPWSPPLWRGYVRTLGVLPFAWWWMLATLVVGRFTPDHRSPAALPVAVLIVVWVVLFFGVLPSIVLFSAPQRLIPPAVRGRPGALAEWRTARHRRRAA